jgi:hypothetical protein
VKRFASLVAAAALVAAVGIFALVSSAGAKRARTAGALPSVFLTMNGSSIKVSSAGSISGGVSVVSTVTGVKQASPTLVRLEPGVTFAQAFEAAAKHNGDPNYLDGLATIVFNIQANKGTSSAQTTLQPGHYVALDTQKNNPQKWPRAEFDITASPSPATLPKPSATEASIEFGFRGPKVLHDGTLVRVENDGFLVHMMVAPRARSLAAAKRIVKLLKAGKDRKVGPKLASGFESFFGPISSMQGEQYVLDKKPGYYVLACFMDTQDGREHTTLGMERIIKIVK